MPFFKIKKVEAHFWQKNGDHPQDGSLHIAGNRLTEGKVVRYFRHPDVDGESICHLCHKPYNDHGWIDRGGAGETVCPNSYIIQIGNGEYESISAELFLKFFKQV
jgi:hypothetical protein